MTSVVAIRPDIEPASVPDVPRAFTFGELVDVLRRAAAQEALSLDALHLFSLRDETGIGQSTIADVRRQCAAFHDASLLLRALEPHEAFIRGIAERAGALA